jgi:predicted nucleic acid-binding OB-fold protein
MISQVSKQVIFEEDDMDDPLDFVVSDDKFELLEMVVDKMKSMEVGESVIVNLVPKMTDEEQEIYSHLNTSDKNEMIYDLGLIGKSNIKKEETL